MIIDIGLIVEASCNVRRAASGGGKVQPQPPQRLQVETMDRYNILFIMRVCETNHHRVSGGPGGGGRVDGGKSNE